MILGRVMTSSMDLVRPRFLSSVQSCSAEFLLVLVQLLSELVCIMGVMACTLIEISLSPLHYYHAVDHIPSVFATQRD